MAGIPNLPPLNVCNSGFTKMYLMSTGGLQTLGAAMWGTGFFGTIEKLMGDETPYECITSLTIFPYAGYISTSGTSPIHIGNVNTGVSGDNISSQFVEIAFGDILCPKIYNNALDYAPYTTVEMILPFIGRVGLPTNIVMGKYVGVTYHCDILTGAVVSFISTSTDGVIKTDSGSMSIIVPINAQQGSAVRDVISQAANIGLSMATGGITSKKTFDSKGNGVSPNSASGVLGALNLMNNENFKENYSSIGGLAMSNGYLGYSSPLLIVTRPQDVTPPNYGSIIGYASSTTRVLNTLSGYTEVGEINLSVSSATSEEKNEIETLLKGGVII